MLASTTPRSLSFFFYCPADHRDLHSFPTRRSSDLDPAAQTLMISNPGSQRLNWSITGNNTLPPDRKSTRLNSSHGYISYAVFCLKKKKQCTAAYSSGDSRRGYTPQDTGRRNNMGCL